METREHIWEFPKAPATRGLYTEACLRGVSLLIISSVGILARNISHFLEEQMAWPSEEFPFQQVNSAQFENR